MNTERNLTERARRGAAGDHGFTLIELLIVIVILGILSATVVFGVARFRGDAQTAACKADLASVQAAAVAFEAGPGTTAAPTPGYPTAVSQLVSGGYLKSSPSGTYTFDATAKTVTQSGCP